MSGDLAQDARQWRRTRQNAHQAKYQRRKQIYKTADMIYLLVHLQGPQLEIDALLSKLRVLTT